MISNLKKFYTIIVLTLPITSQYQSLIPGISFGELILLFIMPFVFYHIIYYKINPRISVRNPFFWLVLYIVASSLISSITQTSFSMVDVFSRSTRFIFYIICAVFVSCIFFDLDYCIQWYNFLAIFATMYLMLQTFLYQMHGIFLQGIIPWFKVTNEFYDFERIKALLSQFYRPSSIFIEPGYYAQFILPFLAYCLFGKNEYSKPKFKTAIFLTIGLLMSYSGQGIILGIGIWALWFISKSYRIKERKIRLLPFSGSFVFPVAVAFILRLEKIQMSLNRLWGSPMASSGGRIYRGFAVFKKLDFLYKIIGVGYGNAGTHIIGNGIYTIFDAGGTPDYMNSIAYILVCLGIIGFIILIWAYSYMFRNARGFSKICFLILFFLSGVGSLLLSSSMILYISLIMSGYTEKKVIKLKKCNNELR